MAARTIASPIGNLTIIVENGAISALNWRHPARSDRDSMLDRAESQLEAYFSGDLQAFDLPLAPRGSRHELAVWLAMRDIPAGRTLSYGAIADAIGSSSRAVGGACGRNPIPVIIPCHRVVGASGALGGYSGGAGAETKRYLLEHERAAGFTDRLI